MSTPVIEQHARAMPAATEAANAALREQLARLVARPVDAVITHVEVNEKHGVGVLTSRIFGACRDILSVRSQNHFGGEQRFGRFSVLLSHSASPAPTSANVAAALQGFRVNRIVCIPYYPDDARTAVALKDLHAAPLCTYLMDDQNVHADGIPDDVMRDLLSRSELRLAISPELRAAYEQKYGLRFWLMPPLVDAALIHAEPRVPSARALQSRNGVVVGNIWGQRWLQLLRSTLRASGVKLDWYCNSGSHYRTCELDELASDGILAHGAATDEELVAVLRERPFVVLPTGTLDEEDDRRFIAQLSLPSRIPYVFATSNTPIVVLGDERTAAARFVVRCGIGVVARYDRASLRRAVDDISQPDVQLSMRRRAAGMARRFSVEGACDWIWASLAAGAAVDDRFEKLLPQET